MKAYFDEKGFLQIEAEIENDIIEIENWCDDNINESTSKIKLNFVTEISYCFKKNQRALDDKCEKQCNSCKLKQTLYKK